MALQTLPGWLRLAPGDAPFWRVVPEFWLYPLQTVLCGALLWRFRAFYATKMGLPAAVTALVAGAAVFGLWVAPQDVFHLAPRVAGGFDPHRLPPSARPAELWSTGVVCLRFARLVLVVPALEEIFWRGCALRYLVREDFASVPFGTFTPFSFGGVALGFMLEHQPPDWPAALAGGALYNLVAIRTRSLAACVLAHAATNLLLGIYIMQTRQWGFW